MLENTGKSSNLIKVTSSVVEGAGSIFTQLLHTTRASGASRIVVHLGSIKGWDTDGEVKILTISSSSTGNSEDLYTQLRTLRDQVVGSRAGITQGNAYEVIMDTITADDASQVNALVMSSKLCGPNTEIYFKCGAATAVAGEYVQVTVFEVEPWAVTYDSIV